MPVDLWSLVSPLRYDIVVRASFFDFIDARRDQWTRDRTAFLEDSKGHAYYVWFRDVSWPQYRRFREHGRETELVKAYAARVSSVVQLFDSYSRKGFDDARPIRLTAARALRATKTGKLVHRPLFAADGCHRLALLLRQGRCTLPPSSYVVTVKEDMAPIDNTAKLLRSLPLPEAEYLSFVAKGYLGRPIAEERELLAAVRDELPGKLAELMAVLEHDLRILRHE